MKYSFNKKRRLILWEEFVPTIMAMTCQVINSRNTLVNWHSNVTFGPFGKMYFLLNMGIPLLCKFARNWLGRWLSFSVMSVRHGRTRGGAGGMVGPEVWTLSMCVSDHIDTFTVTYYMSFFFCKSQKIPHAFSPIFLFGHAWNNTTFV